ncbi:leucine-rich repeat domain-containing protein, partial [Bacillus sp. JJ1566]|uniref:leucine-rich repeat domain-containing protein n=1 Tax=Bacillus sp. JJ1566 TaxID=3122961 RepID=UPI002FFD5D31
MGGNIKKKLMRAFIGFLVILMISSGILPQFAYLDKRVYGAANPSDYLLINETTAWNESKTIDQPVIIAPNVTLTISSGVEINFNEDVIIYGKLDNKGKIIASTSIYANKYGMFSGDLSYPNYGVIESSGSIQVNSLNVRADLYPEPPLQIISPSDNEIVESGSVTIQGTTVPGFSVSIGDSQTTAQSNGSFTVNVDIGEGENIFDVKVNNVFDREFTVKQITLQGTTEPVIPPVEDTVIPEWPVGAALQPANISDTTVSLSWTTATDDIKITNYRIYQNDTLLTTVSGSTTTYSIYGLEPETTYQFKVEAGDAAGNWTSNGPSTEITTTPASPVAKVTFQDPRLEEAVRQALGKPVGDISKEDMKNITSLYVSGIRSLNGLQYAVNLQQLNIDSSYENQKGINLDVVGSLSKLSSLSIGYSYVEDLTFLSDLTQLTTLELYRNNISDLTPLTKLVNLTSLSLDSNQISSLEGLEGLKSLNHLNLYNNQIESIEPLV